MGRRGLAGSLHSSSCLKLMGLRSRLCRTLEYFCRIVFMALGEEEPLRWNAEGASLTCWPSLQTKILSRPEPKVLINIGHLKTGGWNLPCYTSKLHSIKAKHMCQLQLCACSSRVGSSYRCVTGYWTRWAELLAVCALPTESTLTLCNRFSHTYSLTHECSKSTSFTK